MPSRLDNPVLSLSINNIRKVDTTNVDNLFGMWTIFSKCAESLENGRRLENLSWRLWNRETFVCNDIPSQMASSSSSLRLPNKKAASITEIPDLSASVDSVESRHSEKHMSPIHLAKLYENISNDDSHQVEQEWASIKKSSSRVVTTVVPVSNPSEEHFTTSSAHSTSSNDSMTSQSSAVSEHSANSVVRGFSEGRVSTSYRSNPKSTPEEIKATIMAVENMRREQQLPAPIKAVKRTKMFEIGSNTSDEAGSVDSHYDGSLTRQKRAAFVDEVTTRTVVYPAEDEEEDYMSEEENESAIEDDDCSDWEDSMTESGQSSYAEDNMFERMDEPPKPVLPSRRSLLSMLMQQPEETAVLANAARPSIVRSRTSSPNGPSCAPSPSIQTPVQSETSSGISRAKPILVNAQRHRQVASSPRTTRRNMLATELTESLRKNLLWERQQKNQTANAVLRRRHTAHEMSTLNEYPQGQEGSRHNSWNNLFEQGLHEYHAAGW